LLGESNEGFIKLIISTLPDIYDVVGVCRDGAEAMQSTLDLDPDVLLVDVVMPKMDGIQIARELRALKSRTKVIMITGIEDPQFVRTSLAAGAKGYVFKLRLEKDLGKALGEVLGGEVFVSLSPSSRDAK
jgi:DNA-binding NarL/FixJ family response regulator